MAEKSGKSGLKNFCPALVVVAPLHQLLRVWILFPVLASSLRCSSTIITDDRLIPVDWRWGTWCRVWTVRVGLSRARLGQSGQFPCYWSLRLTLSTIHWCLCWVLGSYQSWMGLPRLQNPRKRESWLGENSTLSVLPFEMSASSYYITALDAIALDSVGSSRIKSSRVK